MIAAMRASALAVLLLGGCDLWPLDHPYDPRSCSPGCAAGERCHLGRCVQQEDGAVLDADLLCGNGTIDDGEVCDTKGPQLGGKTCEDSDIGWGAGELGCRADCRSFEFSRCGCAHYFCPLPAGSFTMGSPEDEPCRERGGIKETRHEVTLTHQFALLRGEVSQGYFTSITMTPNPAHFSTCVSPDDCPTDPVESVSWHQAAAMCNRLSVQGHQEKCYACMGSGAEITCEVRSGFEGDAIYGCSGYRLPTEAEWESAYRAGERAAYHDGSNGDAASCEEGQQVGKVGEIAWYRANAGGETHLIGTKAPNAWSLLDMAGNVSEWCHDWFQSDLGADPVTDPVGKVSGAPTRVVRGGSWDSLPHELRAAARQTKSAATKDSRIGFRCARTLDP